jgi:RNA polymerase sigma-B factor
MEFGDTVGGPDERIESFADRHALHQLVGELPRREQRILTLRFFGSLTQTKIAERVGISQMHVSRLLSRALGVLRERLLAEPV